MLQACVTSLPPPPPRQPWSPSRASRVALLRGRQAHQRAAGAPIASRAARPLLVKGQVTDALTCMRVICRPLPSRRTKLNESSSFAIKLLPLDSTLSSATSPSQFNLPADPPIHGRRWSGARGGLSPRSATVSTGSLYTARSRCATLRQVSGRECQGDFQPKAGWACACGSPAVTSPLSLGRIRLNESVPGAGAAAGVQRVGAQGARLSAGPSVGPAAPAQRACTSIKVSDRLRHLHCGLNGAEAWVLPSDLLCSVGWGHCSP